MSPSPPAIGDLRQTSATTCACAIRPLTTVEEFGRCVDVQRAVWGWNDLDVMPVRVFVLHHEVGGLVLGAFEGESMIAFVNSVPGVRATGLYWHSHMMAVLPGFQDRGIGTALKLAQREHARERGVTTIQWVFDPLQPKNAHVNLTKLGSVVRRYSVNHYGHSSSPLHRGGESDRLVAEWPVTDDPPRFGSEIRTITIPADIQRLRRLRPWAARAIQLAVRAAFVESFAGGYVAAGFERLGDEYAYLLRRQLDAGIHENRRT